MTTTGTVPASSGIGAPGTDQAPASLARSPMSSSPGQAAAIPFTRGSSLATMQDYSGTIASGATQQIQLQTNAFLESIVVDVSAQTVSNAVVVTYTSDAPFDVIQSIKLDDPAGQSIIAPITGFQLYTLNKYLPDTDCFFDALKDPLFQAITGCGSPASTSNGGSFNFRLIIPVEIRRRDAFGALNNSAANTRYLLTITTAAYATVDSGIYHLGPTTSPTVTFSVFQQYWTSPPSAIVTSQGSAAVQVAPPGLGSVGFVRFEQHSEVSGGGTPQIQLNNVGDYIEQIQWHLRTTTANNNGRDTTVTGSGTGGTTSLSGAGTNWPSSFQFWVKSGTTFRPTTSRRTSGRAGCSGSSDTPAPTAGPPPRRPPACSTRASGSCSCSTASSTVWTTMPQLDNSWPRMQPRSSKFAEATSAQDPVFFRC